MNESKVLKRFSCQELLIHTAPLMSVGMQDVTACINDIKGKKPTKHINMKHFIPSPSATFVLVHHKLRKRWGKEREELQYSVSTKINPIFIKSLNIWSRNTYLGNT